VVDYEKLGKVRERNKGCRLQPCDGYIGNGYDMRVSYRGDYCKYGKLYMQDQGYMEPPTCE